MSRPRAKKAEAAVAVAPPRRLHEAIVANVRSEVTVNCRIPEIEFLISRYCLRGTVPFFLFGVVDDGFVEYPWRIALPAGAVNLCVDEEGMMIVRKNTVSKHLLALSESGELVRQSPSLDMRLQWLVYHPTARRLLLRAGDRGAAKIFAVDPITWSLTPWAPQQRFDHALRPAINEHCNRIAISNGPFATRSETRVFDTDGSELQTCVVPEGPCSRVLPIDHDRLAVVLPEGPVYTIRDDDGDDGGGGGREEGKTVPWGISRFDPISSEIITYVNSSRLNSSRLHFMNTKTWTSREILLHIVPESTRTAEILLRLVSDGTRLLYVRNDDLLFVFDLETLI